LLGLTLATVGPGTAVAATRVVTPTGSGTACTDLSPCSLATAITGLPASDDVLVEPGDYPINSDLHIDQGSVHGEDAAHKPTLIFAGAQPYVGDAALTDLDVRTAGTVKLDGHATLDRVLVRCTNTDSCLSVEAGPGADLHNVLIDSDSGAGTAAVRAFTGTTTLTNVTARSNAGFGLLAGGFASASATVTAVNSILSGQQTDVGAKPDGTGSTATVNVSYSSFATQDTSGTSGAPDGAINSLAGNLSGALLADVPGGDFHETPASPTINRGTAEVFSDLANPGVDLDGRPRFFELAPDMGAYEIPAAPKDVATFPATGITPTTATLRAEVNANVFAPADVHFDLGTTSAYGTTVASFGFGNAPVTISAQASSLSPSMTYHYRVSIATAGGTTVGGDETFTTAATPPPASRAPKDTLAPIIGSLRLSNRTFKVSSRLTALAATARAGTVIRFDLSEPATVKLAIQRVTIGRLKGRSCRRATKALARAGTCKRYTTATTLTRRGHAGANIVAFSGRVGSRALSVRLPAGRYRVLASAIDAAKNASRPATATFTVVRG
jgi:hypothetical protein